MRKFKSIIAVILLVALVLTMLTGCTGKGKKSGNTYTITSIITSLGTSKCVNVSITFSGKLLTGTYYRHVRRIASHLSIINHTIFES